MTSFISREYNQKYSDSPGGGHTDNVSISANNSNFKIIPCRPAGSPDLSKATRTDRRDTERMMLLIRLKIYVRLRKSVRTTVNDV